MTQAEMMQEIERLKKANADLMAKAQAAKKPGAITLKVSEKGGVSVYGLGRFPVTLYQEQWARLLDKSDDIKAFIKVNADKLTTKTGCITQLDKK